MLWYCSNPSDRRMKRLGTEVVGFIQGPCAMTPSWLIQWSRILSKIQRYRCHQQLGDEKLWSNQRFAELFLKLSGVKQRQGRY